MGRSIIKKLRTMSACSHMYARVFVCMHVFVYVSCMHAHMYACICMSACYHLYNMHDVYM